MKKFVIFMLVAMLMVASLGTAAAAEIPGTTVTIPVTVSGEFANYLISISADAGLTIQSVSGAGSSVVSGPNSAKANWASATNVPSHTVYVTVYIDPAIAPGSYYVSASANRASKVIDVAEDTADGIADGLTATTVSVSGGVVVIEAPVCTHNWGAWTQTKAPTCKETGLEERVCSLCGEKETREVAKTSHNWGAWTETKAPTCKETGLEERVCSICGDKETRDVAKTSHKWGDWTQTKAPTCTEMGKEERVCSICGDKETRDVAMLDHSWVTAWAKDETNHWHECSVCGEKKDVEAHTWSWVVDKPANYDQEGLKHEECVICGQHGKTEKIPQWVKDPDIDDEPQTGDITPVVNFGSIVTVVLALFCVVAVVFKRRTAK